MSCAKVVDQSIDQMGGEFAYIGTIAMGSTESIARVLAGDMLSTLVSNQYLVATGTRIACNLALIWQQYVSLRIRRTMPQRGDRHMPCRSQSPSHHLGRMTTAPGTKPRRSLRAKLRLYRRRGRGYSGLGEFAEGGNVSKARLKAGT